MPKARSVVTSRNQLAVLASTVRQEIVDVLGGMGVVGLSELAAVLGKPADGLYYHVRLLVRAGLVVPVGFRLRAGRKEATFRAATKELALRYASSPPPYPQAVEAIVASMLRLGIRDFRRALAQPETKLRGPRRDLWALRTTGWLTGPQIAEVNRHIVGLKDCVSHSGARPRGKLYGITILLTPLSHRARKRRSPARSRGTRRP